MAEREIVLVTEIKPNYTSQTCPRCGHRGRENWKGYSYFKCAKCNYEADRDRTVSLNIAERAALFSADPKPSFLSGMPQSTGTLREMKGVKDGIKPP